MADLRPSKALPIYVAQTVLMRARREPTAEKGRATLHGNTTCNHSRAISKPPHSVLVGVCCMVAAKCHGLSSNRRRSKMHQIGQRALLIRLKSMRAASLH